MESLFNSPFMVKMQEAGQALGRNRFLAALQGAMMNLMAIIMVGAIFLIACSFLGPRMLNVLADDSQVYTLLNAPYQFTMNLLGLWVVAFLSYNYARNLKLKSPITSVVSTVSVFMLVAGVLEATESGSTGIKTTYLGAQGMFIGFLVTFICVQVDKLCAEKNIYIHMPELVPPAIQSGFAALVPLLFNVCIFTVVNAAITLGTNGAYNLPSGFLAVLQAPLGVLISTPGVILMCVFALILWCFGIHGSVIVASLVNPIAMQQMAINSELLSAGEPAVFSAAFLFTYIQVCGGAGQTGPLVLLGLRSKSEQIRAVAKASLVPGFFGINEPVTFGMPIMYNPILCIPFILAPLFVLICAWLAMDVFGLIAIPWIFLSSNLPIGVQNYIRSLDIRNAIFDYVMFLPCALIYYPFFKVYEKQLVAKEQEALAEAGATTAA